MTEQAAQPPAPAPANGGGTILEASNISKVFGGLVAVNDVDFVVPRKSIVSLIGPNGAGKTTFFNCLTGLYRPTTGRVNFDGTDITAKRPDIVTQAGIARTFQNIKLFRTMTATENVQVGMHPRLRSRVTGMVLRTPFVRREEKAAKARARELLARFDLTEAADRLTKTYSGGMRRRLDLAASLVGRPDVVFLDEPTTGLDPAKRDDVWEMIRALVKQGTTVLLTTQYLEEADALANEITVIDHGKVIAHDTPQGLKRLVGGQTLEVRPTSPGDVETVRAMLAKVGTRAPDQPAFDLLSVPVLDDSALTTVVSALAKENISVAELALRLPSLDEVFYSLTGKKGETEVAA